MANMGQVVHLLRLPEPRIKQAATRFARPRPLFDGLGWLCVFGGIAFILFQLYSGWQNDDWSWSQSWSTILPALIICGKALRFFGLKDPRADLYDPVLALRQAAVEGDERIAPKQVEQSAWPDAQLRAGMATIGSLRRLQGFGDIALYVVGGTVAFTGLALAATLATASPLPGYAPPDRFLVAMIGGASGMLVVLLMATGVWLRRRMRVHVDHAGLWWRSPIGRKASVNWQQARVLFAVSERRGWNFTLTTTYFLDGGDQMLVWRRKGYSPTSNLDSADLLARVVADRAHLPLRDISVEAQRIAALNHGGDSQRSRNANRLPAAAPRVADAASSRRGRVWAWLVPAFIVVVVSGSIVGVQQYQARAYSQTYRAIRAHTPCVTDALTSDDGQWPIGETSSFVGDAYLLQRSSTGDDTAIWIPPTCGDGLIEVTGRQVTTFDLSGIGFVIRRQDQTGRALAFEVTPSGEWWLIQFDSMTLDYHYSVIDIEKSRAILRGSGAWNTVALLKQRDTFVFYVNGQFVATHTDESLSHAQIGLYMDTTAYTASFRDFAMYPAG